MSAPHAKPQLHRFSLRGLLVAVTCLCLFAGLASSAPGVLLLGAPIVGPLAGIVWVRGGAKSGAKTAIAGGFAGGGIACGAVGCLLLATGKLGGAAGNLPMAIGFGALYALWGCIAGFAMGAMTDIMRH